MRVATLRDGDRTCAVEACGDDLLELPAPDVGAWLAAGSPAATGGRRSLAGASFAPVVVQPRKILCLGHNYLSHIREMGAEPPAHPTLFAKYARALVGPRDPIVLPAVSACVDWEAELAIVIGREARHAKADEAEEAIAGFAVLNDVSVRDWQRRTKQWLQGKTFERTTPVGPMLVSSDEVDGAKDLRIFCEVDGRRMQDSRTSDLLFRPPDVVAYVSTILTLEPGDLIATGTPSGVGDARKPPVYLRPGQVVRTVIEGIGELVNECVAEEGMGR